MPGDYPEPWPAARRIQKMVALERDRAEFRHFVQRFVLAAIEIDCIGLLVSSSDEELGEFLVTVAAGFMPTATEGRIRTSARRIKNHFREETLHWGLSLN